MNSKIVGSLFRANQTIGHTTLVKRVPPILTVDALYIPNVWGLYDHGRHLITASGYFRGPLIEPIGASNTTEFNFEEVAAVAPTDNYYYIGPIHAHYGHFLLATFSRFWALRQLSHLKKMKLVTFSLPDLSSHPYIEHLLNAVGYSKDDLISFSHPTIIENVYIPWPSFEETNYVYEIFSNFYNDIGRRICSGTPHGTNDTPIYLAKYKLPGAVAKLDNEEVIANHLASRGVEIIFPETLSLKEQVALFTQRTHFAGLMGSAFHTASFVRNKNLMMMTYFDKIGTNQILIDRACMHRDLFVYSPSGIEEINRPGFNAVYKLTRPEQVADDFMRIFDQFLKNDVKSARTENDAPHLGSSFAFESNIALHKKTNQSSVSPYSLGRSTSDDSAGAVSGFCTGSFQFHTKTELNPWWEIDLGKLYIISEIRIFNRLDGFLERADNFHILAADERKIWVEIYNHSSNIQFGGIDGNPFKWRPSHQVKAQFIRIELLKFECLHLDQVAIYCDTRV